MARTDPTLRAWIFLLSEWAVRLAMLVVVPFRRTPSAAFAPPRERSGGVQRLDARGAVVAGLFTRTLAHQRRKRSPGYARSTCPGGCSASASQPS